MDFRPSIISWNLTRLCNEFCQHCYLDAGPHVDGSDELTTAECLDLVAQLRELAPGALLIFTGGEPLLRGDLGDLAGAACEAGFTVVVGTNGLRLTPDRLASLRQAGVQGVGLSLDSLHPEVHDAFRGRQGAWRATMGSIQHLRAERFPFVLQTTLSRANLGELPDLVTFAAKQGAYAHNLYFLVPTGRGHFFTTEISPKEYEALLVEVGRWQEQHAGRFLLGVRCAPHYQRVLWQHYPSSRHASTFAQDVNGCPAGTHYLGIRPNGDVTPCPYLPLYGGNLRQQPVAAIWHGSPLFRRLRLRHALAGRCGLCEFRLICGGCRARAYAATGDVMGEDTWCPYEPGTSDKPVSTTDTPASDDLGQKELAWTLEAQRLLEVIPAFIRRRVRGSVEAYARDHGYITVTPDVMRAARVKLRPHF